MKVVTFLLFVVAFAACAQPAGTGQRESGGAASGERPSRTLVMAVRYEPESLASVPLRDTGSGVSSTTRLFNAHLDMENGNNQSVPYLAEALPKLGTDTWRVLADGRMETTY